MDHPGEVEFYFPRPTRNQRDDSCASRIKTMLRLIVKSALSVWEKLSLIRIWWALSGAVIAFYCLQIVKCSSGDRPCARLSREQSSLTKIRRDTPVFHRRVRQIDVAVKLSFVFFQRDSPDTKMAENISSNVFIIVDNTIRAMGTMVNVLSNHGDYLSRNSLKVDGHVPRIKKFKYRE